MASQHVSEAEQAKPLEEKIADLSLQEKAGLVPEAAQECLDGSKEPANITVEQVKKDFNDNAEKTSEAAKECEEQPPQDLSSREVKIAKEVMQQSPDDGAYTVPTVDHRSVKQFDGEENKVDVPTAIVHENADPVDKPQQEGKGLIQSVTGKITNSVKSVFSGFTGGKAGKNSEPKINETSE